MSWSKVVLACLVLVSATVLGQRNPYSKIEAESFDVNVGATIGNYPGTASNNKTVDWVSKGDYFGYKKLNFSAETVAVQMRVSYELSGHPEHKYLLRLDAPSSPPFVVYHVEVTGAWVNFITATLFIPWDERPRGVRDLYFTFDHPNRSEHLAHLDWFTFITLDSLQPPSKHECDICRRVHDCLCPTERDPCSPIATEEPSSACTHHHSISKSGKHVTINIY